MIDPLGQAVWFGGTSTPEGGFLDRNDDICGPQPDGFSVENIVWDGDTVPTGTYTVVVDKFRICSNNTGGPAAWTVEVSIGGTVAHTVTGTGDPVAGTNLAQAYYGGDLRLASSGANVFTFEYAG